MSPEMPEKMPQEREDVQPIEVAGSQADIKRHPLSLRGYRKSVDGRNPVLLVEITQQRRLSPECPSPFDVRDEQEPTFIEEYQVSPQHLGFFLYAAISAVSTWQSLLRFAARLFFPASGNLVPGWLGVSKHGTGDTSLQSSCGSAERHAATSKGLLNTPRAAGLRSNAPEVAPFETRKACAVGQGHPGSVTPSNRFSGSFSTTETRKPPMSSRWRRHLPSVCRLSRAGGRADGVVPIVFDFHKVSCVI